MQEEIWKPVIGFEGYYEVSNLGNVRSVERYVKQADHLRFVRQRIKKQVINRYGYPVVTLCRERKSQQYRVHRLVAEAFIPNPENKPFVDHINTNKLDFSIDNLRWVDAKENANNENTKRNCREKTYTKERSIKTLQTKRERGSVKGPKAVYQYAKDGSFVNEFESMEDAMRETGIHSTAIARSLNDNTMSAGGYMWLDEKHSHATPYQRRNHKKYNKVSFYSKDGELIGVYNSVEQAEKETGIFRRNIVRNASIPPGKTRRYKFVLE